MRPTDGHVCPMIRLPLTVTFFLLCSTSHSGGAPSTRPFVFPLSYPAVWGYCEKNLKKSLERWEDRRQPQHSSPDGQYPAVRRQMLKGRFPQRPTHAFNNVVQSIRILRFQDLHKRLGNSSTQIRHPIYGTEPPLCNRPPDRVPVQPTSPSLLPSHKSRSHGSHEVCQSVPQCVQRHRTRR